MANIQERSVTGPERLLSEHKAAPRWRDKIFALTCHILAFATMAALQAPRPAGASDDALMSNNPEIRAMIAKAEAGDAPSQAVLGAWYGGPRIGMVRDCAKSLYWFTRAAEQGDQAAQQALGAAYKAGFCCPKDLAQSAFWYGKLADQYRVAADRGSVKAQFALGLAYDEGLGVPRDVKQALFWLRAVAKEEDRGPDNGHPGAVQFRMELNRSIERLEHEEEVARALPSDTENHAK